MGEYSYRTLNIAVPGKCVVRHTGESRYPLFDRHTMTILTLSLQRELSVERLSKGGCRIRPAFGIHS